MIADFERRLADVLGARLPAPFAGRVDVPPGVFAGAGPEILIGVTAARPVALTDFGHRRPELVPGADDPRRVLRLTCDVGIAIRAGDGGRPQQMAALDAILYAVDAPDLSTGAALAGAPDPGFLILHLDIVEGRLPLDPTDPEGNAGPLLRADGWFWPVGVTGESGIAIADVRLRGAGLPLTVTPARPRLVAGGGGVDLTVRIGRAQRLTLGAGAEPLPFGALALGLRRAGGRPGLGTLAGAVDGVRLAPLVEGAATVRYTPPAEPGDEELVIALDDGEGGLGVELGRFALHVGGA